MRRTARPNTSIFFRPVKRPQPTSMGDIDFYVGLDGDNFIGKTGPRVGIGYSRKDPRAPPPTPGPNEYQVPSEPFKTKIYHTITTHHEEITAPMTTNIDYINHREFPKKKSLTIGEKDDQTFYKPFSDAPPCSFYPSVSFEKPRFTIASKIKEPKPNGVPGPGKYDPKPVMLPRQPAFSLTGPKYRDDWLVDTIQTPSPDYYNPQKPMKSMPYYTIGGRSRSRNAIKAQHLVYAIDTFLFKLDNTLTIEEVKDYVNKHKIIKNIIHEIFETVYEAKPDDPLKFLREHFESVRTETASIKKTPSSKSGKPKLIVHFASP